MRGVVHKLIPLLLGALACGLLQLPGELAAQPASAPPAGPAPSPDAPIATEDPLLSLDALDTKIALIGLDALGMDSEPVARLEALFRSELDRLSRHPLPSRPAVDAVMQRSRKLRACQGDDACLAEIGRALSVDVVVSGNVGALGDSYILNIKAVDARTGKQIRRIASDPLRGNPDELIEAVRVAAYRLLAPEELRGSIFVLTDVVGATVELGGKPVGKTPLPGPILKLPLGEHELVVKASGYTPFRETVEVRFQKSTRVVVSLAADSGPALVDMGQPVALPPQPAPRPWYGSPWFYVGAGVAAGLVGGYIGYRLGTPEIVDCSGSMSSCM